MFFFVKKKCSQRFTDIQSCSQVTCFNRCFKKKKYKITVMLNLIIFVFQRSLMLISICFCVLGYSYSSSLSKLVPLFCCYFLVVILLYGLFRVFRKKTRHTFYGFQLIKHGKKWAEYIRSGKFAIIFSS